MYLSRVGFASRNRPATSASTCAALYFSTILLNRSQSVNDLLLNGGLVDLRQEFVARNFRLLLRELSVALARADRVEFPDGLGRAIRLQNVFPVAEIPVRTSAIRSLVNTGMLNPYFQLQTSS